MGNKLHQQHRVKTNNDWKKKREHEIDRAWKKLCAARSNFKYRPINLCHVCKVNADVCNCEKKLFIATITQTKLDKMLGYT